MSCAAHLALFVALAMVGPMPGHPGTNPPGDGAARPPTPHHGKAQPRRTLKQKLQAAVVQVDWDEIPLEVALQKFSEASGINVVVRWRTLRAEGVERDTPVSLHLHDLTVSALLSAVLDQVSGDAELGFVGERNILAISTRKQLNRKMYIKSYDVVDLLHDVPDFLSELPKECGAKLYAEPGPFGHGTLRWSGGFPESSRTRQEHMKELVALIKATIAPNTWKERGGEATIAVLDYRVVVVRAPWDVHMKLGGPPVRKDDQNPGEAIRPPRHTPPPDCR